MAIETEEEFDIGKYCCCPICGHEFDSDDVFIGLVWCPTQHYGEEFFTLDELITSDDDYAWCQ